MRTTSATATRNKNMSILVKIIKVAIDDIPLAAMMFVILMSLVFSEFRFAASGYLLI